jgi:hypothetical protein
MPVWLPYLPTIISALVQLAKLLAEMASKRSGEDIKECSIAIEDARKTGDVSKLEAILKKMREGKSCD